MEGKKKQNRPVSQGPSHLFTATCVALCEVLAREREEEYKGESNTHSLSSKLISSWQGNMQTHKKLNNITRDKYRFRATGCLYGGP